jgi:hypothetical protein
LKKISGFFRKTLQRFSKNSKSEFAILYLTKEKMIMQNSSSLSSTQTDLDKKNFEKNQDSSWRKFRIFQIGKKFWREIYRMHLFKILSHQAFSPEFLKEIKNLKILSMRYTKLAQMRLVAKISAFKHFTRFSKMCLKFCPKTTGNAAWQTELVFRSKIVF